jgi:hypothetical protein
MRMTKLGAVLASLAVTAGTTAILSAAPAQAAGTTASQATLSIGGHAKAKAQYGNLLGFLEAHVTDPAGGAPVDDGATDLQQKLPGKPWKTVRTDATASDGVDFGTFGSHAKGNVQYRLHYLGDTTFAPTVSNVVTVTTLWNFKDTSACPNGHCHISGKLIPKTKNHKIVVQVKHGGWHKYRVLHTSAKGKYSVKVTGSRKGTKYRIIITATKHITATKKGYIVTVL